MVDYEQQRRERYEIQHGKGRKVRDEVEALMSGQTRWLFDLPIKAQAMWAGASIALARDQGEPLTGRQLLWLASIRRKGTT